jgi:hypothetical protein
MGDRDEAAAVMAALEAGESVTVMSARGFARNHRDNPDGRQGRIFGVAALGSVDGPTMQRAYAERLDRQQAALSSSSRAVRRRTR